VKVSREEFLRVLESVQPGLDPKRMLEQSECFAFTQGSVTTFNDVVCCKAPSGLSKKVEGAVPGEKLLAFMRKLKSEQLDVEEAEGGFFIKGKGTRTLLRMQKEITLPVNAVEGHGEWVALHEDFLDAITLLEQVASKNEKEFAATCLHVHPKWMEAFDQFQMARYKLGTGVKDACLVKRDAIKHVVALGATHVSESPNWLHFKNASEVTISCRKYGDTSDFMSDAIGKVLKQTGSPVVLPKGLADATETADILSSENQDDNKVLVRLTKGRVMVKGVGVSGYHEETKKSAYEGEPLEFLIPPALLADVTRKYNECQIAESVLKVDGGKWKYATALGEVEKELKESGHEEEE
jgi:hypothetical protein